MNAQGGGGGGAVGAQPPVGGPGVPGGGHGVGMDSVMSEENCDSDSMTA